jgi:sugar-specific transcriptional regulator TrmB
MAADEDEAVAALKNLGLSEYEAKVFIALQRLGVGTARDIYRLTDVPRSQVYGAAESLEDRGLLEIKQSTPMEYRPVALDEAEERLESKFASQRDRAFSYLDDVRQETPAEQEEREDIWTLHGAETIDDRIRHLVEAAETGVIFAVTDEALVSEAVEDALVDCAAGSVDVVSMSEDRAARERFATHDDLTVVEPPEHGRRDDRGGRFLVVDSTTVLLSVLGENQQEGRPAETAIWSSDTGFASVLIQLTEGWFSDVM